MTKPQQNAADKREEANAQRLADHAGLVAAGEDVPATPAFYLATDVERHAERLAAFHGWTRD